MDNVLITNGQLRKALAATRSLGSKGIKVYTSEVTRFCPAAYSKYSFKHLICPDPKENSEKYLTWLIKTIKKYNIKVFFPMDDDTMAISIKYKNQIENICQLPVPPIESYLKTFDKKVMAKSISEIEINIPETFIIESIEDYNNIKSKLIYPVIIKSSRNSGGRGISIVNTQSELDNTYFKLHKKFPFPIIQKYLDNGDLYDVFFLYDKKGNEISYFMQKTLRKYPDIIGPSTVAVSSKNSKILNISRKLMKNFKWYGMVNIEFLHCIEDDKIYFIEINPRFGNSLAYSIISNIDFPWYLYQIALNRKILPNKSFEEGLIYRNLFPSDILHYINNPNKKNIFPPFFSNKSYTLSDDILTKNDIKPFLGFILSCLRYLFDIKMWKTLLRKN